MQTELSCLKPNSSAISFPFAETSYVEELSDLLGVDSEEMRAFGSMRNPEGVTAILQDLWATVYLLEALYDHTSLM